MKHNKTLSLEEWKDYVHNKSKFESYQLKNKKTIKINKLIPSFAKLIPVPIIIGLIASYTMVRFYGWKTFGETILSWVIGITIVTIGVATVLSKIKSKLN